jgi:hypothetical protein
MGAVDEAAGNVTAAFRIDYAGKISKEMARH